MIEEETARRLAMLLEQLIDVLRTDPNDIPHLIWQCYTCQRWNGVNLNRCRGCGFDGGR